MAEEIKPGNGGSQTEEFKIDKELWDKTQEQIANLNKGISVLREENKGLKKGNTELQEKVSELSESKDKDNDEEVELDPDDEKKLEAWAKKKGMVTAEELKVERQKLQADSYKQIEASAINEFLEKHPEYNNDESWNKVLAEFNLYKTPTSLEGFRSVLNKIYGDLSGNPTKAKEDGKAEVRVELLKKGRLSLGSGGGGSTGKEADISTLQKRYPNLSREQIESQLGEIDSLYPDNK